MAQQTFAPWAEIVPERSALVTAEELSHLPDDGWNYELVEGRLVRMPLAGTDHGWLAARLLVAVATFVDAHDLGIVFTAETGFLLSKSEDHDTVLGPDLAFLRADRIPPDGERNRPFWRVTPDLVAEVASPDQYRPELADKACRYLDAGVRLVWIVWPKAQQIDVWRAGSSPPPQTLGIDDSLDGADILPGFTYPLRRLFSLAR